MPLVPLKPVLDAARAHGYAQGAFNVNAVCQAKAAIEVHEMFRSPVILQGADRAVGKIGARCESSARTARCPWCSTSTTAVTWRASRPPSRAATRRS